MVDTEADLAKQDEELDALEEALEIAKKAPIKKVRVHAKFLNIPDVDLVTQYPLSEKALRTEYRKRAKQDPDKFVETYNDQTIHIKTWIHMAIESGQIDTKIIANKASIKELGKVICPIDGIKTQEGVLNKLIEHSQMPEGAEFLDWLKSKYD
jgi:hypothetical protein